MISLSNKLIAQNNNPLFPPSLNQQQLQQMQQGQQQGTNVNSSNSSSSVLGQSQGSFKQNPFFFNDFNFHSL
jgi:hypothetical protein